MYMIEVGATMRKYVDTKEEALTLYEQAKPIAEAFNSWTLIMDLNADEIIKDSTLDD